MKKFSKKSVVLAAVAILAATALTGCATESMAMPFQGIGQAPAEEQHVNNSVNLEEAKAAAFAKAGVAESEAYDKDFDFEHGIYEIDFEHGGFDYEYKISAKTGEIIFESIKPDFDANNAQQQIQQEQKQEQPAQNMQPKTEISFEEAKAIAFAAAGIAESEAYGNDFDFEYGRYEIEFEKDGIEYEYVIDAETGAVIYSRTEPDDDYFKSQNGYQDWDDKDFDGDWDDDWDD